MGSYSNFYFHLHFLYLFQNEGLYINKSNNWKYILPTSYLKVTFLLNTITDVNCIQSVLIHCKLQQSEVTRKKRLVRLNNIETNKINKREGKIDLIIVYVTRRSKF